VAARTAPRPISEGSSYNYDAVGNLLEKTDHETQQTTTYTYNEADQITNTGFGYDDNGNQTAEPGATYEYDSQNRMTGAMKGGVTYSYSYDGDGNRVSQAEDGSAIEYIVDRMGGLAQVVAEVTLDNTIEVFYVRGDDLISQWRKSDGSETVSYYGCDGQGSTVILTDSGGVATDHWFYDAWGNIVERHGSTVNVFRYTGQQQDGTGLYYLRARHYSPTLTRFLQRDPVEGCLTEPLTLHKYCYCINNPVNRADPTGLQHTLGSFMLGVLQSIWLFLTESWAAWLTGLALVGGGILLALRRGGSRAIAVAGGEPATYRELQRVKQALGEPILWPTNWGTREPLEDWQTTNQLERMLEEIESGVIAVYTVAVEGGMKGAEFPLARGVLYIDKNDVKAGSTTTSAEIVAVLFAEFTHSAQGLGIRSETRAQEVYRKWLTGLDASGYQYRYHKSERFWTFRHGGNTERWVEPTEDP